MGNSSDDRRPARAGSAAAPDPLPVVHSPLPAFEAYLFDLDGTLIDSAPDIHRVANLALAEIGRPAVSLAAIRGFIGDGLAVLVRRALNASEGRAPDGPVSDEADYARAVALANARYEEEPATLTTLYPGAEETLRSLSGRAYVALVTNKPQRVTERALSALSLSRYFGAVVGGGALPQRKPDPAPVVYALGGRPAARALFIGDSENDLAAGRGAGAKVALVTFGYTPRPALEALSPDYLVDDLRELPAL